MKEKKHNYNITSSMILSRQTRIIQTDSDEFLEQCDTEAFLKFSSYFSTEFSLPKEHIHPRKTAVSIPRFVQIY